MLETAAPRDSQLTLDLSFVVRQDAGTAVARTMAWLLDTCLVLAEEWDELPPLAKAEILECEESDDMLDALIGHHLLTPFQADMVKKGKLDDTIIGSYRLLEPIGRGGMGIVYRGEHLHLRRPVAVKLTTHAISENPRLVHRFFAEARAVARLQHPNIVTCLDAGRHQPRTPGLLARDYFVMEYVPGQDLDSLIRNNGPLPVYRAADLFRQIADALAEAHRHGLVHRDLKPSNILVTPDWQGKLLDFGLALHPRHQLTDPGTLLGTVGYMAPEQARDPHSVDGRADLFSLGATLYWALTGREPYPETGSPLSDLTRRLNSGPPDVRLARPELPADVAELLSFLMEPDPNKRYPSAAAVSHALQPFTRWVPSKTAETDHGDITMRKTPILIVDSDESSRKHLASQFDGEFRVHHANTGEKAFAELEKEDFALVVMDASVTGRQAGELIGDVRRLHADSPVMILVLSATMPIAALSGMVALGADDFMAKPFTPIEFRSRVRALLGKRETLHGHRHSTQHANATMRVLNDAVNRTTPPPNGPQTNAWDLMTVTISRVLTETGYLAPGYRSRVARYVRALAQGIDPIGEYTRLRDPNYLTMLAASSALYDIGMLVIPGGLPLKPGKLDPEERQVIQTHPNAGADILLGLAEKFPGETGCVSIAIELARGHHERWDGTGYPDRLLESANPLSARVVALASAYDTLRSRRPYRPSISHTRTTRVIVHESPGRYDPHLLAAFNKVEARFDQIYNEYPI